MGMTLNFYIFMRLLRMIFYFSLGAMALALLADFTELSNRTSDLEQYTIGGALLIAIMRLPFIISVAIPFIVMFATMTTLMNMNQKYELVVARASGVSAWQFLAPMWVAAFLVGVFMVGVVNPMAAAGFSRSEAIEGQWRARPAQSLLQTARPWLRQSSADGGAVLIGAERASRQGTRLFNVAFIETDAEGVFVKRTDAQVARLGDQQWILRNTVTISADQSQESQAVVRIPTALDPAVITQALIPAEMVPFLSLPSQITAARSFGISASPFRMQYHSLIALPALLVAMTLIAATVSLRFVRFGQSAGMILAGIGAGFALYVLTALAKSFGSAGILPATVAAWTPVAMAMFFGIAFLLHREDG